MLQHVLGATFAVLLEEGVCRITFVATDDVTVRTARTSCTVRRHLPISPRSQQINRILQ